MDTGIPNQAVAQASDCLATSRFCAPRLHGGQCPPHISAEDDTPRTSSKGNGPGWLSMCMGVSLHVYRGTVAGRRHPHHHLRWVSLELTPVDILPKPPASTRPWRVYHLQACHGPARVQLHLQASHEVRGPGKPPESCRTLPPEGE